MTVMANQDFAGGSRVITAFFDDRRDADHAIDRLMEAGIMRDRIRLVPGYEGDSDSGGQGRVDDGAGIWDMLRDFFMPEEDRHTYAEGLRRGGFLVTVSADEPDYSKALEILDDEGTVDMSEREASWRSEGWSGYSGASEGIGASGTSAGQFGGYRGSSEGMRASGTPSGQFGDFSSASEGASGASSRQFTQESASSSSVWGAGDRGDEEVIPVVEEQLRVGKRDVSHGRVRVRSYIVETPVSEDVTLREENVSIERRPVDRPASGDDRLFEDRTIELEERAEEAVIAKEARVKEELAIRKNVDQRQETVKDTVRRTEVDVQDERDRSTARKPRRTS